MDASSRPVATPSRADASTASGVDGNETPGGGSVEPTLKVDTPKPDTLGKTDDLKKTENDPETDQEEVAKDRPRLGMGLRKPLTRQERSLQI